MSFIFQGVCLNGHSADQTSLERSSIWAPVFLRPGNKSVSYFRTQIFTWAGIATLAYTLGHKNCCGLNCRLLSHWLEALAFLCPYACSWLSTWRRSARSSKLIRRFDNTTTGLTPRSILDKVRCQDGHCLGHCWTIEEDAAAASRELLSMIGEWATYQDRDTIRDLWTMAIVSSTFGSQALELWEHQMNLSCDIGAFSLSSLTLHSS